MHEYWQTILTNYILPGALAIALYLAGKLVNAICARTRVYLESHDLGIAEQWIEAAIVWVEVHGSDLTGPDKMTQVLRYLTERDIDVEAAQVEAIFQALKRAGELPEKKETTDE
jgi:hypothetical protein